MPGAELPNQGFRFLGLSEELKDQAGAQEGPYPGEATADQGDPGVVGHEEYYKAAHFAQHGDQGEGNQQIGDQRKQDMLPPHAPPVRPALRLLAPAVGEPERDGKIYDLEDGDQQQAALQPGRGAETRRCDGLAGEKLCRAWLDRFKECEAAKEDQPAPIFCQIAAVASFVRPISHCLPISISTPNQYLVVSTSAYAPSSGKSI